MLTKPGERAVNGDDREVNEGRSGPDTRGGGTEGPAWPEPWGSADRVKRPGGGSRPHPGSSHTTRD